MKSTHLAYFLSTLGIFVFGCTAAHDDADSSAAASSAMSAVDAYLASNAFKVLPPDVAAAAKASLDAAGNKGTHALVGLYSSQKFLELAAAQDPASCTTNGTSATLFLIDWARTAMHPQAGETADGADARFANAIDGMLYRLTDPRVDITKIDATISNLGIGLFLAPSCGAEPPPPPVDAGTPSNDCVTTSNCPNNSGTGNQATTTSARSMLEQDSAEASEQLASYFAQAAATPSAGMTREWTELRARWSAGVTHAARAAVRTARLTGSATIGRDVQAAARFEEAAKLVDAMVRGKIAPTVNAMNLVHAAVASSSRGEMRTAGQNVAMGRVAGRDYLPGAQVKAATDATFALARQQRANGVATPAIAATFDQRMISIHPYMDANGRTTRLMTDWTLMNAGYPPALTNPATRETTILAARGIPSRTASLDHITEGMRRTVHIIEQLA